MATLVQASSDRSAAAEYLTGILQLKASHEIYALQFNAPCSPCSLVFLAGMEFQFIHYFDQDCQAELVEPLGAEYIVFLKIFREAPLNAYCLTIAN
jgi:hypothetical protein